MDNKIDNAEKVMGLVSNHGLATVLAVAFAGYLMWNNYLLVNRLEKYSHSIEMVTEAIRGFDRRLEIIEERGGR